MAWGGIIGTPGPQVASSDESCLNRTPYATGPTDVSDVSHMPLLPAACVIWFWDGRRVVWPAPIASGLDEARAIASSLGWAEGQSDFIRMRDGFALFRVGPISLSAGHSWRKVNELSAEQQSVMAPPKAAELKTVLYQTARFLGFPLVGAAPPLLPERYTQRFSAWLRDGAHGELGFLARAEDKRLDPALVMANVKSVVALATPYPRESPPGDARIARYALGDDYHQVIPKRLSMLRRMLMRDFPPCQVYLSSDTGPVLERAYAEQAGLGWIGKNGNLISREYGSYLFLATLWLDQSIEFDAAHTEFCGTCNACVPACPTQAIVKPGWIDAKRCLPYWNIEHRGDFPAQAPALNGWLFGCDLCQEACPWNRFAQDVSIERLAPRKSALNSAAEWSEASDEQIAFRVRESAMKRAGPAGLRRNVLKIIQG